MTLKQRFSRDKVPFFGLRGARFELQGTCLSVLIYSLSQIFASRYRESRTACRGTRNPYRVTRNA